MKHKVRLVFSCSDCGYRWFSPWYEPTWFGRRIAIADHEKAHDRLVKEWDDWADYYGGLERQRIIKLIEDNETLGYGYLVALINGEK